MDIESVGKSTIIKFFVVGVVNGDKMSNNKKMIDVLLSFGKRIIPTSIFRFFQPAYHWILAYTAAIWFGFPSRRMTVIGVTGTNGKSTVTDLLHAIFLEAGESVASASSIRFKINDQEKQNTLKMTMPGRFCMQKFLYDAKKAGCRYVILEVTSEGIKQFRDRGIRFAAAILTNVTPEHIESHGGFEQYRATKAKLFYRAPLHVLNGEDKNIEYFSKIPAQKRIIYTKQNLSSDIHPNLIGGFNYENMAAAYVTACEFGIAPDAAKKAIEHFSGVSGRLEFVQREPFSVVVDYAHTPDALRKVYKTLRDSKLGLICVLGATGGGRDKWKRPEMGRIASEFCDEIILTNEDPYDEDPKQIISEIESGIPHFEFPHSKILDRREAIREAMHRAQRGDMVIITGKGCEPWMVVASGKKIPWDDRAVVREELAVLSPKI